MSIFKFFLFAPLILLSLNSCSLYESDSRKFIKEQGLEFAADNRFSISTYSQKHCRTLDGNKTKQAQEEWIEQNVQHKVQLDFYHYNSELAQTQFCRFLSQQETGFTSDDYQLIEEICDYYVSSTRL